MIQRMVTLAALLALAGCNAYSPGGAMYSYDTFTYVSEPHSPKTVSLKDTRTQQTLWTVEIPVGQQLVVKFNEGTDQDDLMFPDLMRWDLMTKGDSSGALANHLSVPPSTSRRLDMAIRPNTELPKPPAGETVAPPPVAKPDAKAPSATPAAPSPAPAPAEAPKPTDRRPARPQKKQAPEAP